MCRGNPCRFGPGPQPPESFLGKTGNTTFKSCATCRAHFKKLNTSSKAAKPPATQLADKIAHNYTSHVGSLSKGRRREEAWTPLAKADFALLAVGRCYLCGNSPAPGHVHGVDRLTNELPYTVTPNTLVPNPPPLLAGPPFPPTTAQCQSCCPRCNHLKGEYPLHDTLDHLRRILANAATPAFQAQFGFQAAVAQEEEEDEDLTQPPP
jgi:hypothetical protein